MTDIDNDLPTPRAALVQAYQRLQLGDAETADTWIYLAKELREGATRPPRDERTLTLHDVEGIVCVHGTVAVRRFGGPGSWFLHTNDGTTCDGPANQHETDWRRRRPHSPLNDDPQLDVGQRLEDDSEMYVGQASPATTLSDLRESETTKLLDVGRLRGRDLADGLDATAVLRAASPAGPPTCRNADGLPIEWIESGSEQGGYWRHILTAQRVCPTPQRQVGDETYHPSPTHTFAEPA
jgi:hypothetical protein